LKKILLIDNTFDPPHGSPEIVDCLFSAARPLGPVTVTVARAPQRGIPKDVAGFDGAVLSGSKTRIGETEGWIELEMEAIRRLYAAKIPTLGICYGEQLIARTLGGKELTGVAKTGEHGWAEIEVKADSPLLEGLPKKFFTYEYHSDEVRSLPANFRLTAGNAACPVQAYEASDAPIWGLQFHPERGLEKGNEGLDRRLKADPKFPALNRDRAAELFDPSVGQAIFRNFLAQVWRER
jgi:GMP synthase (glutamine-hydrolysing)